MLETIMYCDNINSELSPFTLPHLSFNYHITADKAGFVTETYHWRVMSVHQKPFLDQQIFIF